MTHSLDELARFAKVYGYKTNIITVDRERGYLEIKEPQFRCRLGYIAYSRVCKISTIEKALTKYFGKLPF